MAAKEVWACTYYWREERHASTDQALDVGGVAAERKGPDRCPVETHLHVADLSAERTRLEAQGVTFAGPTEWFPYGGFARLEDPDGNPLILFQPGDCPLSGATPAAKGEAGENGLNILG